MQRQTQIANLRQKYEAERTAFHRKQEEQNSEVNHFENAYLEGDRDAIIAYCSMVLERSVYPETLLMNFALHIRSSRRN